MHHPGLCLPWRVDAHGWVIDLQALCANVLHDPSSCLCHPSCCNIRIKHPNSEENNNTNALRSASSALIRSLEDDRTPIKTPCIMFAVAPWEESLWMDLIIEHPPLTCGSTHEPGGRQFFRLWSSKEWPPIPQLGERSQSRLLCLTWFYMPLRKTGREVVNHEAERRPAMPGVLVIGCFGHPQYCVSINAEISTTMLTRYTFWSFLRPEVWRRWPPHLQLASWVHRCVAVKTGVAPWAVSDVDPRNAKLSISEVWAHFRNSLASICHLPPCQDKGFRFLCAAPFS